MKQIAVAAAVIENARGEILIARRPDDKHQGGLWEFPGGKIEAGEPVQSALYRELAEELGIAVNTAHPLIRIHHNYPDKAVLLDVWRVTAFTGEAHGAEGQPIRWVAPQQLDLFDFPAANKPILAAAQLPSQIAVLGQLGDLDRAEERALDALQQGVRWLMLRDPDLNTTEFSRAYRRIRPHAERFGATLVVNCSVMLANNLGAEALHLTAARLVALGRREEFRGRWLGASCHHPGELLLAEAKGLDYVSASPVVDGQVELGWQGFYQLTEQARIPVYARGGLTLEQLDRAQFEGAQGVIYNLPTDSDLWKPEKSAESAAKAAESKLSEKIARGEQWPDSEELPDD